MSGIYIKGMEMPKSCAVCDFCTGGLDCWISKENVCRNVRKEQRSKACPLIPVPEHGDLIDRTAFRYEMDNHYPFDKATQSRHGVEDVLKSAVLQMLFAAPTIIPADKEGK